VARHFRKRTTLGKASEQHSDTKVFTIGPATDPVSEFIIRDTQQGARLPDGDTDTIQLGRGNNEECNVGDTCKYLNVFIEVGPRLEQITSTGWVEWALCMHKQSDAPPGNTNLGTNTLGDVCTKYLRNECILTGSIPVGKAQPNYQEIKVKVPKFKQVLRTGDQYILYLHARTVSATETATNTFRVLCSFIYRNYH